MSKPIKLYTSCWALGVVVDAVVTNLNDGVVEVEALWKVSVDEVVVVANFDSCRISTGANVWKREIKL
jgi:hypothetical protein